jgi:outer membrane protein, heavy metal efflux system
MAISTLNRCSRAGSAALVLLHFLTACLAAAGEDHFAAGFSQLSLSAAKRLAFEHNWDLLAAKANVDLATAQEIVAKEFPNPTLSLSTQKINVDGRSSSTALGSGFWGRNYDTIAAVNQLVEIGGKRGIRQESAAAGQAAARASLQDARRLLDLGVGKAYIAVLLAEANGRIINETASSLRHEAEIADTRLKAGDLTVADKEQIEIAADRAELDAKTAELAAVNARVAVEVLLGVRQPKGTWKATDSLEKLAAAPLNTDRAAAATNRPDAAAAEAALRKAEADVRLQKALRVPDPTFLVQYEHEPPDQPSTIGVGISIPLPLWNFNRGNIRAAEATRDQAALEVGKVQGQIAADIVTAEAAQKDALSRWKRYRDEIQPKSAKVLEIITYSYKKGGSPLLALLQAARTDNDARLATAQAMADCASAVAALEAARNLNTPVEDSPSPTETKRNATHKH